MHRVLTKVADVDGLQVVTFDEAKTHIKIGDADDDTFLQTYIDAAIDWAEDYTRRPIRYAQYLLKTEGFQTVDRQLCIRLQGTVASVDSVRYRNSSGVLTTIDGPAASPGPAIYEALAGQHSTVIRAAVNQSWPALQQYMDNLQVTFTAGWTGETVPAAIRHAILLKTAAGDALRAPGDDDDAQVDRAARRLLDPWVLPVW